MCLVCVNLESLSQYGRRRIFFVVSWWDFGVSSMASTKRYRSAIEGEDRQYVKHKNGAQALTFDFCGHPVYGYDRMDLAITMVS